MASESDIESYIVLQLAKLGWQPNPKESGRNVFKQLPQTPEEKSKLGQDRPDFMLYADADSKKTTLIIEAKKPRKSISDALEQGKKYARLLSTPIVIATDGYLLKTWNMEKNAPLFYNNSEVDELITPALATHFSKDNVYESFSKNQRTDKAELITKFKEANNILRDEKFEAGIGRFSEFANLMFLKLKLEGGGDINGLTWQDVENKSGRGQLTVVKSMLGYLRREHSDLFQQTKIERPKNMEKLIDILSSFELSQVRDDIKGVAFEHFIHSYTQGVKNDLGQFFTPRHIIKMMVAYLRPQIGETIYDPFCGTGGMLIECFRYIERHGCNKKEMEQLRKKTIWGRDKNSVARIAMMNMIMFGDGHSNVTQGDSYEEMNGEKYDIVITNIPFSQSTDYTEGYPVCPARGKNGDSIGVQHCLMSLKKTDSARAAIIVPVGFLYKNPLMLEREYLYKNFNLERVVELTPKCFNPYTEAQTAVLMLRRKAKERAKTLYFTVENDGLSQDGYRVPLPGINDIDKAIEGEGGKGITISAQSNWKFKKIIVPPRPGHKRLRSMADIYSGDNISPKTMLEYTKGGYLPIVMTADLAANHIDYCLDSFAYHINDLAIEKRNPRLFPKNTIIIPSSGKSVLLNHRALLREPAYLTTTVTGIIANEGVNPYYLLYWLLRWDAAEGTYDKGYPGLKREEIGDMLIPDVSEEEEKRIIAEIAATVKKQQEFKKAHRDIINKTWGK